MVPIALSLATLFGLYYLHNNVLPPVDVTKAERFFHLDSFRFKLFMSGAIPFLQLACFFYGVFFLLSIYVLANRALRRSLRQDGQLLRQINEKYETDYGFGGKLDGTDYQNWRRILELVLNQKQISRERFLEEQLKANGERLRFMGASYLQLVSRYNVDRDLTAVLAVKEDMISSAEDGLSRRFISVNWAEGALPLLGFLGTVMGIGIALGRIREAVMSMLQTRNAETGEAPTGGAQETVSLFTEGFQSLALAFDTTFLGLSGLLVLGLVHVVVKKDLAHSLAHISDSLNEQVTNWTAANQVTVAVSSVGEEVAKLRRRVDFLSDQVVTSFTKIITEVEDPPFPSIRRALLRPYVEFKQLGADLPPMFQKAVQRALGSAQRFAVEDLQSVQGLKTGCAVMLRTPEIKVAMIHDTATCHVDWLNGVGSLKPERIFSSPSKDTILIQDQSGAVWAVRASGGPEKVSDAAVGVMATKPSSSPYVALLRRSGVGGEIIAKQDATGFREMGTMSLEGNYTRKQCASHPISGSLALLGASNTDQDVKRVELIRMKEPTAGSLEIEYLVGVNFRSATELSQLQMLSADEVIFLDTAGTLYYWNEQYTKPEIMGHQEWKPSREISVYAGGGGWFAQVTGDYLRMWHIASGTLSPYRGEPQRGDLTKAFFTPTFSGEQLLMSIRNSNLLGGWEFPTAQPGGKPEDQGTA